MSQPQLPERLEGLRVYMVGIKGTGMAALAEILVARGASVTGSDVVERFYTDAILEGAGVRWFEGFDAANVDIAIADVTIAAANVQSASVDASRSEPISSGPPDLVIYSAAYDPSTHPELVRAAARGLPLLLYTEALGQLSRQQPSVGIAGVHGKTTTTAFVAAIAQELGLPGTVLAGSSLADLDGRATLVKGTSFFVAETCEYRRNFLSFSPKAIVITSVEADHLDYFHDAADIESAFLEYGRRLDAGGTLVYCADDHGASEVARALIAERDDVHLLPYGLTADGPGCVEITGRSAGLLRATICGVPCELRVPGDHNALNAAAALLVARLVNEWSPAPVPASTFDRAVARAVSGFRGTRRRSEIVGEAGGITIIDDYAHHPTAIASTLAGFKDFYPGRRIVLSFMSHTYSRTLALLDEFARALSAADVLVLHDIYASAREENPGNVDGEVLAVAAHRYSDQVHYVPGVSDAAALLERILRPGDLFVTMGAGNNWQLGPVLLQSLATEVRR